MPTAEQIQQAIREVTDQRSFIDRLLRDTLRWPIHLDFESIEDITYEWTDEELNAVGLSKDILSGPVLQMQSLEQENEQPWGIFILEFANEAPLATGRGLTGPLRKVLRGLVPKRRDRQANLPAWNRENLLFICTHQYYYFRFAYFKSPKKKGLAEPLTTFGWEPGIPPRTVCEFNLGCLSWPKDVSDETAWQKQWANAFDKEPLTREFFKRFDNVLERMKADLQEFQRFSSAEAYSRSQLLLERLIFLYFLQNRGWLNRRRHYFCVAFEPYRDTPDKWTFYEEFLEPLFWTLASAPGSGGRLDGIPFLNGGLFDDDEFDLSPVRKKNNPPLRIRNSTFQFAFSHLLEAFNFTVREDTPLDQDVAVDPEMLGKVFESIVLHAEAQADYNAPDKRKATGSYYTPRIVVHFICRESLRLYLKGQLRGPQWDSKINLLFTIDPTDGIDREGIEQLKEIFSAKDGSNLLRILSDIKTCDPAVGSGAFPVGLLHELVSLRRIAETIANGFVDPVRREGSNWIHDTKADIVENCLHGVDIQQQAIEICRLRLWLSLIVDYDLGLDPFIADTVQFQKAIHNISQLPNLEMNFRRGDSLLDMICGVNVRIETSHRYRDEYERIRKLSHELHKARKAERKRRLRLDILKNRLELSVRVISDEIKQLQTEDSNLAENWFGETKSDTKRRRKIAGQIQHLQEAQTKIQNDLKMLAKIVSRPYDSRFYPELRKLEGAEFDAPFNFAWRLDYADILQRDAEGKTQAIQGGFDLILGNPPFVTARDPEKRELYRERWMRVCFGTYHLLCPFFELSFGLLRPKGQLGFIVSNAFAKRKFGKPLIEDFFPSVNLQKIVDCSGLLFPGHGTPTCIIFGSNEEPIKNSFIRTTAMLPGGGDLCTTPEESALWQTIATHHNTPGYTDARIQVTDRLREIMERWPWIWDVRLESTRELMDQKPIRPLRDCVNTLGYSVLTKSDDIFFIPPNVARRYNLERDLLKCVTVGDEIRNWSMVSDLIALCPYDQNFNVIEIKEYEHAKKFLFPFKSTLESVITFGKTKKEAGRRWYEYFCPYENRHKQQCILAFPDIVSHSHFALCEDDRLFKDTAPLVIPRKSLDLPFLTGLLNSSIVLFWLKQECFNKGTGEHAERDRYEFATSKVEKLPVPKVIIEALHETHNNLAQRIKTISQTCWDHSRQIPSLTMKKLFEKSGEAYQDWNASLPGYTKPDVIFDRPFETTEDLRNSFSKVSKTREELRGEMIALQEEMDWLVYAAYGLIPMDSSTISIVENAEDIPAISREKRPFVLWQQAEGDFVKACTLIPSNWAENRKSLWHARLEFIRDNEHIRRIEQPVYKRRWDEQWKVGNAWQCGPVAYDTEFVDAFSWWLSEKAEWWLEHQAKGGPVELDTWTSALREDSRVQAAWAFTCEVLDRLGRSDTFERYFRNMVKSQSVSDNIPWAVPWDELQKKIKIPASVKRIRGKLNVPRERFCITSDKQYVWAGQKLFDNE